MIWVVIKFAVLGLESRKKVAEDVFDQPPLMPAFNSDVLMDSLTDVRQYAHNEPLLQCTSVSDSDGPHHFDTKCDNGDFGTFTVSYDAPSPRSRRDTCSSSHDEAEENTKSPLSGLDYNSATQRESPQTGSHNKHHSTPAAETGQVKKHTRPQPVATRAVGKALTGIPVARSVGDVARASRGDNTAPLPRAVKKGRQTPPPGAQSTWSCWRQETDVSDAVSESGGARGRRSVGENQRRSCAPRSAPTLTTRSNRTFALRCAAKKRAEVTTSPASPGASSKGKPSRSRSAENNARLALAARSGSGSREQSQKEQKERTRQPSSDSLTSLSSNLSIATHDGSYFRRDGGRYSMRVEKSSTTGSLSSASKQLHVVGKLAPSGSQPKAKPSTGKAGISESKEMTAWKRRKEYDPRKSVAAASARRGTLSQSNQRSSTSPDTGQHDAAGVVTADEIAKLSNAVAYNLSVLSQSSQSDAVTLVSYV